MYCFYNVQLRTGLILLFTLLVFSWSARAADPLAANELLNVKSVGEAVISPNGEHVAYSLAVPGMPPTTPEQRTRNCTCIPSGAVRRVPM